VPKLWDIERKLSVLEAKRLQAFPDNFIFPVSNNQAYKQLGNSVTTTVVREIARNILKALE
jgi:DNA (cytosine-5)-methyltransferase 1